MKPFLFHPEIFDSEEWEDQFRFRILFFLIGKAKQRDSRYKGFIIRRGEVKAGRGFIEQGTGISEQIIRTRIKWMELSGTISIRVNQTDSGERFSVITINNYDRYQRDEIPDDTDKETPPAAHEPKPLTPYQKKLEDAKKQDYSKPFERWWSVYGKGAKGGAWFGWLQTPNKPPIDELIQITLQYKEYCKSMDRPLMDGQGWLRQRFFDSVWTHEAQGTTEQDSDDNPYEK